MEYLQYGFIPSPQDQSLPMCLNCMATFSNETMKPCKLKKHLVTSHPDKKDKPLEFFKALRNNFEKRPVLTQLLTERTQKLDKGVVASYKISKLIAKTGHGHNVGESLILPSLSIIISDVMNMNPNSTIQAVPLSNSTVRRRIDEMARDIEERLVDSLRTHKFSLQLDETCLQDNDSLLMAYVRFWNGDKLMEEMLFAKRIKTDTRGLSIFEEMKSYLAENNIPLENIIACATDGAASMVGRYRGFIAHLKKAIPSVFTIHCVIHRQHLVSKNLGARLNHSLSIVIRTVNFIKSHALRDRLFRQLCEHYNENFRTLLLHTEVRWLSKGNCLRRFVTLWNTIVSFMSDKEDVEKLIEAKADIFYLADIFEKLDLLNKNLQGRDSTLVSSKEAITSFLKKLEVYWHNMGRREFLQFPNVKEIAEMVTDDDLLVYVKHLQQIRTDMEERFHDLINLNIPDWILNPFVVDPTEVDTEIQESLIDLQSDTSARHQFSLFEKDFWMKNDLPNKYPTLWEQARTFFVAFPSTYLVECGFSKVASLTKTRSRLDVATRGDLRLSLSNLEPNIDQLAQKYQAQGSH